MCLWTRSIACEWCVIGGTTEALGQRGPRCPRSASALTVRPLGRGDRSSPAELPLLPKRSLGFVPATRLAREHAKAVNAIRDDCRRSSSRASVDVKPQTLRSIRCGVCFQIPTFCVADCRAQSSSRPGPPLPTATTRQDTTCEPITGHHHLPRPLTCIGAGRLTNGTSPRQFGELRDARSIQAVLSLAALDVWRAGT